MNIEDLKRQLEGAQFAAASHLRTVEQQAKIISGMSPPPIPAGYRLVPVALHPAIEEALKRHCMMPNTAWQDVIAAWDRVKPAAPVQSDNLAKLRKLAEAATPGPWEYQHDSDAYTHIVRPSANLNRIVVQLAQNSTGISESNAHYIAAANPAVILRLLDALAAPERSGKTADDLSKQLFDRLEELRVILQRGTVTIDKIHELGPDGPAEEAWLHFYDEIMPLYRSLVACAYCGSFGPHDPAYPHPSKSYEKLGAASIYEVQRNAAEAAISAEFDNLFGQSAPADSSSAAPSEAKAAFEAWAVKEGHYDLRPAKWTPISHGGVPHTGYLKHYENDRTRHTFEGFAAALATPSVQAVAAAGRELTDADIERMWREHVVPVFGMNGINANVFARAIEAHITGTKGATK